MPESGPCIICQPSEPLGDFPMGPQRLRTLRRQEGGCLFGALAALSQHALLFSGVKPQDGEDGNKTEGKLF